MKMKIEFDMDNEAFESGTLAELRFIFDTIKGKWAQGSFGSSISDSNGNRVGQWEVVS